MKEYIISLIIITVVAAVLCYIVPNDGMARHQKLVAGLCIICVGLSPAVSLVRFVRDFDIDLYIPRGDELVSEYGAEFDGYRELYSLEASKAYIKDTLSGTFAVGCDDIRISYRVEGESMVYESIYIQLPREAIFKDTGKMKIYFENIFGCDVTVAVS